jgi:hypothetical protein
MSQNHRRMLVNRAEVLLRTHRALMERSDLLPDLGHELSKAEQRVARRLLASRLLVPELHDLFRAQQQLKSLGFRRPQSLTKRAVDWIFPSHAEAVAVHYYRWFRPNRFAKYVKGFA